MSETLSYGTPTFSETSIQEYESESYAVEAPKNNQEIKDDSWGGALMSLVSANENVMVRCPWMGGAEVALGTAMTTYNYPPNMTAADEPGVMSVVYELLANRVTETDELEEQDLEEELTPLAEESEEEEVDVPAEEDTQTVEEGIVKDDEAAQEETNQQGNAEGEDKKNHEKQIVTQNKKQHARQPNEREQQKPQAIDKIESPAQSAADKVSEGTMEAAPAAAESEPAKPALTIAAEAGASEDKSSSDPVEVVGVENPSAPEAPAGDADMPEGSGHEAIAAQPAAEDSLNGAETAGNKLEDAPAQQVIETSREENSVSSDEEAVFEPEEFEAALEQGVEPVILPAEVDIPDGIELMDARSLEREQSKSGDDIAELIDGEEVVEDNEALAAHNFPLAAEGPADLAEEEILLEIAHFEEAAPDTGEQDQPSNTVNTEDIVERLEIDEAQVLPAEDDRVILTGTETSAVDQAEPISRVVEEVKDSLVEPAERIETSEPEVVEKANEKLDKIVEIVAKVNADDNKEFIGEDEAQKKLEELFTELFEEMDIDYTPEMVESVARLVLQKHLAKKTKKAKLEEDEDNLPQDSGTHEAIAQILVGLNAIDESMEYASVIGKSALRLCSFSFAMAV